MAVVTRPFQVFSGQSNEALAQAIADRLQAPLGRRILSTFSDGEIQCEIQENVRGIDCYVVQSTSFPSNTNLMELLIMGDALKRASARSLCAVIPYYGYSRQDRKTAPRTPITAKLIANLISAAGFNRVITVDLHAGQIQGFFDFPVDHLFGSFVIKPYLRELGLGSDVTIVSPDAGGTERARIMAKALQAPLAIVDKRRSGPNEAKAMNLIGEIKGRVAIVIDDMIDTAGTLLEATKLLRREGASQVMACATHGIFSGPSAQRLTEAAFDKLIVTDTIPLREELKKLSNLHVLSVAPVIAETILRNQNNDSVSDLFSS